MGSLEDPRSLVELVEAVRALPYGRPRERSVAGMLREGRGTCSTKHLFLAEAIARLFPELAPRIVHRVYRLHRSRARALFGQWSLRRQHYLEWLQAPLAEVLVARGAGRLLGYAMVRVEDADNRAWGDRIGVLETLVVREGARGAGLGETLLDAATRHLATHGIRIMRIGVAAGNEDALRFYRREGAVDFMHTLVMPVAAAE